jgi:hypothetical protein
MPSNVHCRRIDSSPGLRSTSYRRSGALFRISCSGPLGQKTRSTMSRPILAQTSISRSRSAAFDNQIRRARSNELLLAQPRNGREIVRPRRPVGTRARQIEFAAVSDRSPYERRRYLGGAQQSSRRLDLRTTGSPQPQVLSECCSEPASG